MIAATFVEGLIIGLAIAAPVGPIGVLCIRRTLNYGRLAGFLSGLGVATADGFYGFVAAFGLTAVSGFLLDVQPFLRFGGGAFLVFLGLRAWRARPQTVNGDNDADMNKKGLVAGYAATVVLTLANPSTILSFLAIFAGLGLVSENRGYSEASVMVLGVFLGSAIWWLFLAGLAGALRRRLDAGAMVWINRFSAVLLAGFGALILAGFGA